MCLEDTVWYVALIDVATCNLVSVATCHVMCEQTIGEPETDSPVRPHVCLPAQLAIIRFINNGGYIGASARRGLHHPVL
eukprot:COSAG06_NODE_57233_length_281_cov_0.670330_1_plen_78_part_01